MAVSINEGVKYPVNVAPQAGVTHPNFHGADTVSPSNILEKNPSADTIEISSKKEKKKGLSTGAKWGIGLGLTALGCFGAIKLGKAYQQKKLISDLEKFFNSNLKINNLPEKIEFKDAKTIDEGIEFAKKKLNIEYIIGDEISLEALNWTIRGLVNVANANKGKTFIPKGLEFRDLGKSSNAGIYLHKNNIFGRLMINSTKFKKENLIKEISLDLKPFNKELFNWNLPSEYTKLLAKAQKEGINSLTVNEMRYIADIQQQCMQKELVSYMPETSLSVLKEFKNDFNTANIKFNYDEISKIKDKKLRNEKVLEIIKEYKNKTNKPLLYNIKAKDPYSTIYHEVGHGADLAENWKNYLMEFSEKEQDHFVSIFKPEMKNLFNSQPEVFKKRFPASYEFLTNPEKQRIASHVSAYSTFGIGEFKADVYAGLIQGKKFSPDVMELYKKYNGPLPNGFK